MAGARQSTPGGGGGQPRKMLPALRQDLRLLAGAGVGDGTNDWLIYDPVRHRYFQIDESAFQLISLWREVELDEFIDLAKVRLQRDVSEGEVERLVQFVFSNNLGDQAPNGDALAYARQISGSKKPWWSQAIHSYLFFKIPIVRPHRFLEATLEFVAPLYTRTTFWLLFLIMAAGLYLVSRQWHVFTTTFLDFLSLEGMVWYGLSLIFIKTLHELGHAYTAARAGVRVNTMGIAFMLGMPILYTDVTDAWKLKSRREKVAIAGAGMAVELAIAAVATFLWVFLPDGAARSVAFVLATTSWIMSLAVNLNPFMRFDGYYLLADMWGISNLQSRAFAMARWWLREQFFGLGHPPPDNFTSRTRGWLIAYAIGVWIYRLILFLGIALLVYHMFFKALGLFLFAVEIAWFILLPIWKELTEWSKMRGQIIQNRRSWITASIVCVLIALAFIPWSGTIHVAAVAQAERESQLFAPRPARVVKVLSADGERVAAGARIAVLESPDLDYEIIKARHNIDLSEARLRRIAADAKDRSQRDIIERELAANKEKLAGLLVEQRQMLLAAPFDGEVRDRMRDLNPGNWIDHATPVARVISPGKTEAYGYIHEDDLWQIKVGGRARFIPEDPLIGARSGKVIDLAKTGSDRIEIKYLASVYGGDVPSDKDSKGDIKPRSGRYLVKIALDGQPLDRVVRGTVRLDGQPVSVAAAAWRRVLQVLVRESGF